MTRRIGALAVALALVHFVGCSHLFNDQDFRAKVIGAPVEPPKVPEASVEAAARVDAVGRELLAGTPLGIPEVAFHTVGSAEPEVYHNDPNTLYITEGLVNLCKSDDELAAVLATEVGKMTAEFRRTVRKQSPDPISKAASPAPLDRASDYDPGRDVYLAQFEKHARKPAEKLNWPTVNATTIGTELLRNSGRDAKLLGEVAPQLKLASRNTMLARQLGGRSQDPRWSP
jgi:hypothetical protein